MRKPEWIFQCQTVRALRTAGFITFAVPNGGSRNIREAVAMKASGTLAGAPDLVVAKNGRVWFIELKTGKGRQSPAQKEFEQACWDNNIHYCVISTFGVLEYFINNLTMPQKKL